MPREDPQSPENLGKRKENGSLGWLWWLCPAIRAWEQSKGSELSLSVPLGLCSKFQARSHKCAAPLQ